MPDLVDSLLKGYLTPILKDAGFKRAGAAYRLAAPNRDVAVVNVRRWTPDPAVEGFHLFLSAAPLPYVEWLNRANPASMAKPRGQEHALLQWTLRAPVRWQLTPQADTTVWRLGSASDVDTVGAELGAVLAEGVPWLVSLFDHSELCSVIQSRFGEFYVPLERHLAQAVLLSASGPRAEVERLLAASMVPVPPVLQAWITNRLPS
jgi:hypothetical protein